MQKGKIEISKQERKLIKYLQFGEYSKGNLGKKNTKLAKKLMKRGLVTKTENGYTRKYHKDFDESNYNVSLARTYYHKFLDDEDQFKKDIRNLNDDELLELAIKLYDKKDENGTYYRIYQKVKDIIRYGRLLNPEWNQKLKEYRSNQ